MISRAFIAVAGLAIAVQSGCGPLTFTVGTGPADQKLTHTVVLTDGQPASSRVAMIDVSGMILNMSPRGLLYQGDNPVSVLHEKLQLAQDDARVKAIILRLNTPGGTVTATDAMYREIERFKEESGKPVIALMMDVAASGGYYLACSSDTIVAYPTTITGSIGVIMQTITFKPAMDRFGIHAEAFTSGPNKAAGSPLGDMTDEHRQVLRKIVDDFYVRFTEVVRQKRPNIPPESFATVTDGRVLTGDDALRFGLVDQLGDLHDAFALAKQMANLPHGDLIVYHRPQRYVGSPYVAAPTPPAEDGRHIEINLAQINLDGAMPIPGATVGFYYLWQPALP